MALIFPPGLYNPNTLRKTQSLFAFLIAHQMLYMFEQGYEVTCSDFYAWLEDKRHQTVPPSNHYLKLAADLNLYKGGQWLADTSFHLPLGTYWKTLHPLCRWGGDFKEPDGNHYSLAYGGNA